MRRVISVESSLNQQRRYPKKQPESSKWTCLDKNGFRLTGGGLVPYDENGIWAIREGYGSFAVGRSHWNDIGGKWRYEDIDIFGCIAREWNEETYFTCELRKRDLVDNILNSKRTSSVYIHDHQRKPTYITYFVHVEDLEKYGDCKLNTDEFTRARDYAVHANPDVPEGYFSSVDLGFLSFEDLGTMKISYRLKRALIHGRLKSKIKWAPPPQKCCSISGSKSDGKEDEN